MNYLNSIDLDTTLINDRCQDLFIADNLPKQAIGEKSLFMICRSLTKNEIQKEIEIFTIVEITNIQ